MTYQALARKWRPDCFEKMVGQEHVLQALINSLDHNRLHHAYLFSGTRGVGKTTVARILAKCLNCETKISSKPCGKCTSCMAIAKGNFVDLIEVDAASRTKVEDTRELLNNVQYAPSSGRFKIYLIDEVHMLSGHSFNALLKTLEEPPTHVKFLLATTDPQKLPVTVLSRCLQFHLKNLLPEKISGYLAQVLEKEAIEYESEALEAIAYAADGSMRDALSLLDQAIAFGNYAVTQTQVNLMLGTVQQKHLFDILEALKYASASEILMITENLAESGVDFLNALDALLTGFHKIALMQATQTESEPKFAAYKDCFSKEDIQLFYQIALMGKKDLPLAPCPRAGFEMALLRMLDFKPAIEAKDPNDNQPTVKTNKTEDTQTKPNTNHPAPKDIPAAKTTSLENLNWDKCVAELGLKGMLASIAQNCELKKIENNQIYLTLQADHAPLLTSSQKQRLEKSLSEYYNDSIRLNIEFTDYKIASPANKNANALRKRQKNAETAIATDPVVDALLESFNATVDNSSIEAISQEV